MGTKEDARALNVMPDTIAMKAQEAGKILMEDDKEISAQAIKNYLMGIDDRKTTLKVFTQHNLQVKALIGKEYAWGTYDLFNRTFIHTHRSLIIRC